MFNHEHSFHIGSTTSHHAHRDSRQVLTHVVQTLMAVSTDDDRRTLADSYYTTGIWNGQSEPTYIIKTRGLTDTQATTLAAILSATTGNDQVLVSREWLKGEPSSMGSLAGFRVNVVVATEGNRTCYPGQSSGYAYEPATRGDTVAYLVDRAGTRTRIR